MSETAADEPLAMAPAALADARDALETLVPRLTSLVRGAKDPGATTVSGWSVSELAVHLTHVFGILPSLATGELTTSPLSEFWDLGDHTVRLVAEEPERDLDALAERIDSGFRRFVTATTVASGDETRPWLVDGLTASPVMFHCHILNEVIVHGFDLAQATDQTWAVDPVHAALVLQGFILRVVAMVGPRTVVNQDKAAGLKACYEVRLRGAGRVLLVFDDGDLTLASPSSRPVDCHVSADPAELLLVLWRRKRQWGPIALAKITAWGRRPWLAFRLVGLLKTP